MSHSRPPSSTSGTSAASQRRPVWRAPAGARVSALTAGTLRTEKPHPPQLGELALVRMEHEVALIPEARLENRPLPLAQHQRVRVIDRAGTRARAVRVEEHPVKMEAVDQIEFGQVHQIDAHQVPDAHANRLVHV